MEQLSDTLRSIRNVLYMDETFRPPHGVEARVRAFRYLEHSQKLGTASRGAKEVWDRWGKDPTVVALLAQAIRDCIPAEEVMQATNVGMPEYVYGDEGIILTRVHVGRERNSRLVRLKKESFQDTHQGHLYCEACDFDFARSYPKHGKGFIECHHIKPLSELKAAQKTTPEDLALLCANCHRMIHYRRPWLSMDGLQTLVCAGLT